MIITNKEINKRSKVIYETKQIWHAMQLHSNGSTENWMWYADRIILKTHLKIEQPMDGRFYHNNSFALTDQLELD